MLLQVDDGIHLGIHTCHCCRHNGVYRVSTCALGIRPGGHVECTAWVRVGVSSTARCHSGLDTFQSFHVRLVEVIFHVDVRLGGRVLPLLEYLVLEDTGPSKQFHCLHHHLLFIPRVFIHHRDLLTFLQRCIQYFRRIVGVVWLVEHRLHGSYRIRVRCAIFFF